MKLFVNLIIIVIAIIFLHSAHAASPWAVQVFTLDTPTETDLQQEFNALAARGVETVIFRSFKLPGDPSYPLLTENAASGLYFKTRAEPLVSDLLPIVIRCAHRADMQCFAWVTTRKAAWILKAHPTLESRRIDVKTGLTQPSHHLDIFRPDVSDRLQQILLDLAATGVDGILVQDDLVSRQGDDLYTNLWNDFSGETFNEAGRLSLFQTTENRTVYTPRYLRWAHFKSRAIAGFLTETLHRVKSEYPDIKIAVNLYYEAVTMPQHGRNWLAQDLDELMKAPVDYWAVMAYQRQMIKELEKKAVGVGQLLARASDILTSGYLIPEEYVLWKLQVQDWETREQVSQHELGIVLNLLSPERFVVVPYRGLRSLNNLGN